MNFCPTCGTKRASNVCTCGYQFERKKTQHREHCPKYTFVRDENAIAQLNSIRSDRAKNYFTVITIITTCLAVAIDVEMYQSKNIEPYTYAIPFIVAWMFSLIGLTKTENNEQEYYSLPNTKNDNGQHQCLFCGHRGIYKSTIYKTNTVVSKCSKCEEELFRS